jgi:hypothetical protein
MPHLGILGCTAVHAPLTQTPNHSQNRRGRRTLQSYPHETGTEQEHRTGTGMKNSRTEVREATRLISSNGGKSRGRARTERIPNPQRNKHSGAAASRRRRCLPEASSATAGARASASGIRSEEARTRNPISASLGPSSVLSPNADAGNRQFSKRAFMYSPRCFYTPYYPG